MKKKVKLCRWCGLATKRRSGICLDCCEKRDAYDKLIDEGKAPYIPPEERPNHRFYKRKQISPAKQDALNKANAARIGGISRPNGSE